MTQTKNRFLILVFMLALSSLGEAQELGYKLILSKERLSIFNPQQNIFTPSAKEQAYEEVGRILGESAFGAMVPVLGQVQKMVSGAKNVEIDYLEMIREVESAAVKILTDELARLKEERPDLIQALKEPITQDFYLLPWEKQNKNLFYDEHKISQSKHQAINLLNPSTGSLGFEAITTRNIQALQKQELEKGKMPVFLLGMRHFFLVDLDQAKSAITIRMLLGLKPNPDLIKNFNEKNPPVVLDRVTIPGGNPDGLVANLELTYALGAQGREKPVLNIQFGHFAEFKDGSFQLKKGSAHESGPTLEGTARKGNLPPLAINFTFTNLVMDVDSAQLSSVKTFVSPGIRFNGVNHVLGKFHHMTVDEQFKAEINRSIKAQIDGLVKKILSFGGKQ